MNPQMIVALMMLANVGAADAAMLTIDGNSLASEYCTLDCDMEEAHVGMDSIVSFNDQDLCTIEYRDTDGRDCDLAIVFRSTMDLTGHIIEIVLVGGSIDQTLFGEFVGNSCAVVVSGVESHVDLSLSASMPGVRGVDLDVTMTASPIGAHRTAHWEL